MSPDEKNIQNADVKEEHQTNGIHNDEEVGSESVFVKKVLEIPAIYDMHTFAKENKYGKIGFQMVGSAGNIVSNVAKPFQNQIRQADKFAADSVCYVEGKFPFVKQPTSEIVDNLKKPALQTISAVKTYQETFGTTIDNKCITPAYSIASNVQTQINERAVGPTIVMAKRVDASLTGVVNKFESTLNTYLPEEDQGNVTERSLATTENNTDSTELLQTFRAINIALAGQRRLTRRVKTQINKSQVYGNEQLKQLQESSALLKSATETVAKLNQMLLSIAVNVKGTVQNPELIHSRLHDIASVILGNTDKNEDLSKVAHARVIELSSSLLQTTDAIATYVKANAMNFPEYIRLNPLTEFFEQRYTEIVKEIKDGSGTPIEKARNVIQLTTQHTIPLLGELQGSVQSYSSSLNHSLINTTEKVKSRFIGVTN